MSGSRIAAVLRRIQRLTLEEIRAAAVAQAYLVRAWWYLRTARRGGLVAAEAPPLRPATAAALREAERIGLAVDRAARYGLIRTTCLVRSVAMRRMLERAGIGEAALRVGVRRGAGGFGAHAWVEVGGRPLGNDGVRAHAFQIVDDINVRAIHGAGHGRAGR